MCESRIKWMNVLDVRLITITGSNRKQFDSSWTPGENTTNTMKWSVYTEVSRVTYRHTHFSLCEDTVNTVYTGVNSRGPNLHYVMRPCLLWLDFNVCPTLRTRLRSSCHQPEWVYNKKLIKSNRNMNAMRFCAVYSSTPLKTQEQSTWSRDSLMFRLSRPVSNNSQRPHSLRLHQWTFSVAQTVVGDESSSTVKRWFFPVKYFVFVTVKLKLTLDYITNLSIRITVSQTVLWRKRPAKICMMPKMFL